MWAPDRGKKKRKGSFPTGRWLVSPQWTEEKDLRQASVASVQANHVASASRFSFQLGYCFSSLFSKIGKNVYQMLQVQSTSPILSLLLDSCRLLFLLPILPCLTIIFSSVCFPTRRAFHALSEYFHWTATYSMLESSLPRLLLPHPQHHRLEVKIGEEEKRIHRYTKPLKLWVFFFIFCKSQPCQNY